MSNGPVSVSMGSTRSRTKELNGLRITDVWFPGGTCLPDHTHDRAIFAVVLEGFLDSRLPGHELDCGRETVWTEPAGERHSNRWRASRRRSTTPTRAVLREADTDALVRQVEAILSSIPEVDTFSRRTGVPSEVRLHIDRASLPPAVSIALFRILQEALTNVARHASATSVAVTPGLRSVQATATSPGVRP